MYQRSSYYSRQEKFLESLLICVCMGKLMLGAGISWLLGGNVSEVPTSKLLLLSAGEGSRLNAQIEKDVL